MTDRDALIQQLLTARNALFAAEPLLIFVDGKVDEFYIRGRYADLEREYEDVCRGMRSLLRIAREVPERPHAEEQP